MSQLLAIPYLIREYLMRYAYLIAAAWVVEITLALTGSERTFLLQSLCLCTAFRHRCDSPRLIRSLLALLYVYFCPSLATARPYPVTYDAHVSVLGTVQCYRGH